MSWDDRIKNLQIGESFTFTFKDSEGNFEKSPWGLIIPDLTVNCVKYSSGKTFYWHYDEEFAEFMYQSFILGISNVRLDKFIEEKTSVPCHSFNVQSQECYKEKFADLQKRRLQYHKNALLATQDFEKLNPNICEKNDIDLSKEWFKARLGVLAKLDPDFRNEVDVNYKFAQINIAPKKKKDE